MIQKDLLGEKSKLRIAVVNVEKCKPQKCALECKKICPSNQQGNLCVEVEKTSKTVVIHEELCVGCSLCVKRCPYSAIKILNLPRDMAKDLVHRYGMNSFKLHRLPTPRVSQVLGLVGANGIGKSTALHILACKIKPNLGRYSIPPEWDELLKYFRGSELQSYFAKIVEGKLKTVIKPQYVDVIPRVVKGKVIDAIRKRDETNTSQALIQVLGLGGLLENNIEKLSGGELQRFAILIASIGKANVFMFDEPSSYLDIKYRLAAAQVIRGLADDSVYVICVEHDLSLLDYLSDFICCLYGEPSVYGVVTHPMAVREGINIFLSGFVPSENMRFRDYELTFKVPIHRQTKINETQEGVEDKKLVNYSYPSMIKQQGQFSLTIDAGSFNNSQVVVMLGENGTGKTTFLKMLAGKDPEKRDEVPKLSVSYKPQTISPTYEGIVRDLLQERLNDTLTNSKFNSEVIKPLSIEEIIDKPVKNLSGGELQRVALVLALGKPAEVYLIDEPSAYLDAEQRVMTARLIKRYVMNAKKAALIVEHDFIMATYLADKVIVYEGVPGLECHANSPQDLIPGMNKFLSMLGLTFRRDPENFRPRINKLDSIKDRERKLSGNYFCVFE